MDLAIYQDLFLNFEAFGQGFDTAVQSAIDAWANGFNFFGDNTAATEAGTTAEAGTAADFTALSSQFGSDAGASAETDAAAAAEAAQSAGLELNVDAGVDANL